MHLDEKKKFIINFAYFALWGAILYLIFKVALTYLFPFLIGIIVAYLVQKPSVLISKKIKLKKEISAAILSVITFIFVVLIFAFIIWILCIKSVDFFEYLRNNIGNLDRFYRKIINNSNGVLKNEAMKNVLINFLNAFIGKTGDFLSEIFANFIKKIPAFFISSIVTIVATCYISKDYDRLKRFLKGIISEEFYKNVVEVKSILLECIFKFIVGYFWIFIITFSELLIGFWVLGVDKFFILAILIAFFDLLPVIGTGTILLPWSIVLMFQNEFNKGIGFVILYLITVLVKNFIEPKIIGKQIEINSLFMLVFIFLGLKIGGIIGMILFPITLTVLYTYYRNKTFS